MYYLTHSLNCPVFILPLYTNVHFAMFILFMCLLLPEPTICAKINRSVEGLESEFSK